MFDAIVIMNNNLNIRILGTHNTKIKQIGISN